MTETDDLPEVEPGPERPTERTSVMLTPSERAAVDFIRTVHEIGSIPDVLRRFSVDECVRIHRRAIAATGQAA